MNYIIDLAPKFSSLLRVTAYVLFILWLIPVGGGLPVSTVSSCFAQDAEPVVEKEVAVDEELLILKKRLKCPRATISSFLEAMANSDTPTALSCLDLSNLSDEIRTTKGTTYAVRLRRVLEHPSVWSQNLWTLSDDPEYEPPFVISETKNGHLIQLFPNKDGLWKFSRTTLETVDQWLAEKLFDPADESIENPEETVLSIPLWIESRFPASMRKTQFLIQDYKWICIGLLILTGFIVGRLVRFVLDQLTNFWFRFSGMRVSDRPRHKLWVPVGMLAHAGTWYFGAGLIDLPAGAMSTLLQGLKFLTVIAAIWTAFQGIELLGLYLQKRAAKTVSRYDDSLVPLICNALKVLSVLVGVVLFVDVFELEWQAVLGGFGVGGIAIAIAAKDMIGNIFGSVTVLTDRPFEIGDWVVIDGRVEGTVESVGMRSSRIRTFYNSEVVVPNSLLTTAIVDNMGRRSARRMKTFLQVKYDTPVQRIESFCAGVRQLIENNPYSKGNSYHVYVNQFGESSIDILVYLFFECQDWAAELREKHCMMIDILTLAEELGVEFAFPTRTLEISSASGTDSGLDDQQDRSLSELGEFGREVANRISHDRK